MFERKTKTFIRYVIVAFLCTAGLAGCGSIQKNVESIGTESSVQESTVADASSQESTAAKDHGQMSSTSVGTAQEGTVPGNTAPEITIRMVGDILLHDRVSQYARQEDGSYEFNVIFEDLKEEITEADLAIVNQEVIIAGEEFGVTGYPTFNAPFALGDALVDAGFDVVCHGTNHALDKGKKGLLSCLDFWETKYPEIAVVGIYETAEESDEIYIYEQDGIKIAVLNYTYGTNGIPLPGDMPYAVNLLKEEEVVADIKKAEELADFTIVCPHWGTEYVLKETAQQRRWAEIFLKQGVDLVLGTHPHVIEPIEMMKDEETGHEMLVYYSLGNFVNWTGSSGKGIANRMVGGMADVTVGLDEEGRVVVKEYSVTALVTHLEKKVNGVYTTKLRDYTEELSLQNQIIAQDASFSKAYCVELCKEVWGNLW